MSAIPDFEGGCLCGAVRYSVTAGTGKANVCFCSMCRKATGAPVPSQVTRSRGTLIKEGTGAPVYYAGNNSTTWGLTAGSAEVTVPPAVVFYYDQHPEWLAALEDMPKPDIDAEACSGDT